MDVAGKRFIGRRQELVRRLLADGIPTLWCPALTHYGDDGAVDRARMRAHLRSMQPWVRGFLVPGSTGEGWDMSDAEVRTLLGVAVDEIRAVGGHLLVGVLKTTVQEVLDAIRSTVAWLEERTGIAEPLSAMERSSVCGFTVCPPSGSDLPQERIRAGLEEVLDLGLPVALYQLPQVTRNEMAPETVAALAARHPGFYLFKDTSGADRVAASGFRDAFLVRGAEGDYARHLAAAGGDYDGFLLSTANCFGRQLSAMIDDLGAGRRDAADAFSRRLSAVCAELFDLAGRVGHGNAFANANKAMDHFMAHGPDAARVAAPRLHSGVRLPRSLLEAAGASLARHGLLPARGYLAGS